jgi:putative transposase
MKRARFTEEQIIAVLREHEAGAKTADLARKQGISEATLYNWKAKFGGMDVSEAKRLKQLEDVAINPERVYAVNAKLKKLLAEQYYDQASMKKHHSVYNQVTGDQPKRFPAIDRADPWRRPADLNAAGRPEQVSIFQGELSSV